MQGALHVMELAIQAAKVAILLAVVHAMQIVMDDVMSLATAHVRISVPTLVLAVVKYHVADQIQEVIQEEPTLVVTHAVIVVEVARIHAQAVVREIVKVLVEDPHVKARVKELALNRALNIVKWHVKIHVILFALDPVQLSV